MFPTYQRTVAQFGIATDGIGSNPLSGELRPDREMAPHTRQLVQLVVEDGYDDFLSHVAMFRGLEKDAVDAVAQGRVWTGADALERARSVGPERTSVREDPAEEVSRPHVRLGVRGYPRARRRRKRGRKASPPAPEGADGEERAAT